MIWILLDASIALFAVGLLMLVVLRLWRQVRSLSRNAAAAGSLLGEASAALDAAQQRNEGSTRS